MSVKIGLGDVLGAGHLRCWVSKQATSFIPEMMDIYTGWILLGYDNTSSVLVRDSFDSFVPLGPEKGGKIPVQQYPLGATAIVSASISSYGRGPDTVAVDSGRVGVKHFKALDSASALPATPLGSGGADLLVLTVDFAISEGFFNRIAYQITVLAPVPSHVDPTQAVLDYDLNVLQLADGDQPL
jgi:hypothetical protein